MSSIPRLSIIIPTYRRADILQRCLEHIARQTVRDELEVIVVSDGPDQATKEMFTATRYSLLATRYFEIPKSHQGVARNRGVAEATAPLTLFIGDDIFLAPNACEHHLKVHDQDIRNSKFEIRNSPHVSAVLGHITWDPSVGITPTMQWLEESGWQFGFPMIQHFAHRELPKDIQHRFTYTSHTSVPTEIARKFPFRDDVSLYGWEDIEWGTRLAEAGVPLVYEPDARALHHHRLTLEESLKRMEVLGQSAVIMERLAPHLRLTPKGWKFYAYIVRSLLPTLRGKHASAFLQGVKAGQTAFAQ